MENLKANPLTDKALSGYIHKYERHLSVLKYDKLKILELGIREGGSLLMWKQYFKNSLICGIDIEQLPSNISSDRIVMKQGNQSDILFLSSVSEEIAPEGFDLIIDDASHIGDLTKISFNHLFHNHLKEGGLYVIEDWGTGYWKAFPDGKYVSSQSSILLALSWVLKVFTMGRVKRRLKSHDYGMVGFIKQLVDECGIADITKQGYGVGQPTKSSIEWMEVSAGLVFIKKSEKGLNA